MRTAAALILAGGVVLAIAPGHLVGIALLWFGGMRIWALEKA